MVSDTIKWGVLGNASIARTCVIPAIQKSHNGTVHGLATRDPEKARPVAATHNIPHLYGSYEGLLADPAIAIVYNPLPNHLHHAWTLAALKRGKHVLCEKPLALSAAEAEEMAEAAAAAGLLLMESYSYRFHPRTRRIKKMVAESAIGRPCLVRSAFCFHLGEELLNSGDNPRLKRETGGGALLDVGCYSVSVSRWLLGSEPTHVQAQAVYHPGGVDLHFVGSLRFPGDVLATLEASFITALQQTYTVVGSEGAIELPHDAFIPWEKDAVFTLRSKEQEAGVEHSTPAADGYQLMVEHFGEAVSGKIDLAYPTADSVWTMRVLDALAEAARTSTTRSV